MFFRVISIVLFCALAVAGGSGAAAAQVATVLSAEGGAVIVTQGRRETARSGLQIREGAMVETDETGSVLLTFADETRIAVGPRSRFEVRDIRMRSDGTAGRFAVRALGGTYRFLSGNSPKEVYRIRTPTATMGIRGTEFDFFVDPAAGSNVALFRGEVVLCPDGGPCALIRGRCTLAISDARGNVGLAPSRADKGRLLVRDFPFVVDQRRLPASFQTSTSDCGNLTRVAVQRARRSLEIAPARPVQVSGPAPQPEPSAAQPQPSAPQPEPPSQQPEPSAPQPEAPSPQSSFPGQSGSDTPNAGKGNEVSRGQDGSGVGNGRGPENRSTANNGAFGGNGGKGNGNGKGRP